MKTKKSNIPFFPNHLLTEVAVALVFIGVIFILATMFPRGLGAPANPMVTPQHILPDWYFLWMYALLRKLPKLIGIVIPVIVFIALFAIPWLDRSNKRRPLQRPIASAIFALAFIGVAILTYISLGE